MSLSDVNVHAYVLVQVVVKLKDLRAGTAPIVEPEFVLSMMDCIPMYCTPETAVSSGLVPFVATGIRSMEHAMNAFTDQLRLHRELQVWTACTVCADYKFKFIYCNWLWPLTYSYKGHSFRKRTKRHCSGSRGTRRSSLVSKKLLRK